MENMITIPTAAQAREAVKTQANRICERVWNDILFAVKNCIESAISECRCSAYLPESCMRGVSVKAVHQRLLPILSGMGYAVKLGKFSGIIISWKEADDLGSEQSDIS